MSLRNLIGNPPLDDFSNPRGTLIYPYLDPKDYESILDFGCGCGRVARQLIQQTQRPRAYLGLDLNQDMIEWCKVNLASRVTGFRFEHHDIYNIGLNPTGRARTLPLPAGDRTISLFNAISVFTHLVQDQVEHYLREAARVLRPRGALHATWFLFDKSVFPMMQDFQNALFINETDPSNAVIFDRDWLRRAAGDAGLVITWARPPEIRGFHWHIVMRPAGKAIAEVELPSDNAPTGHHPPPLGADG
jgi:SAM-dependent methyltransferase